MTTSSFNYASSDAPDAGALTPMRRWVVYSLIAILIGGHFYDTFRHSEHWPFSNYPMFSGIMPAPFMNYEIVGLTRDPAGNLTEVPIDWHTVPALPVYKFAIRMDVLAKHQGVAKLTAMMSEFLTAYEMRRQQHMHQGQALQGVRLYKISIADGTELTPQLPPEVRQRVLDVMDNVAATQPAELGRN